MTVTYQADVATAKFLTFSKLMRRWHGSIYKLLWAEFLFFSVLLVVVTCLNYLVFAKTLVPYSELFFQVCIYCNQTIKELPLTLILGFYVSLVVKRWWDLLFVVPWPDQIALFVTSYIGGFDDAGRIMRRTIMRYVNLSVIFLFRDISVPVKKRFPTLDHVVSAGMLTIHEKQIIDETASRDRIYWIPIVWAMNLVHRARVEKRIVDDHGIFAEDLLTSLNIFREKLRIIQTYDWINVPLVYPQIITFAVYVYFFTLLFAYQYIPKKPFEMYQLDRETYLMEEFYFPAYTITLFIFYMGWAKVAEGLMNPFGENDDDLDCNWYIERNISISYAIVDDLHNQYPELIRDAFWDRVPELPHTLASYGQKSVIFQGSTANVIVKDEDAFLIKETIPEEPEEEERQEQLAEAAEKEQRQERRQERQRLVSFSVADSAEQLPAVGASRTGSKTGAQLPKRTRTSKMESVGTGSVIAPRPWTGSSRYALAESSQTAHPHVARAGRYSKTQQQQPQQQPVQQPTGPKTSATILKETREEGSAASLDQESMEALDRYAKIAKLQKSTQPVFETPAFKKADKPHYIPVIIKGKNEKLRLGCFKRNWNNFVTCCGRSECCCEKCRFKQPLLRIERRPGSSDKSNKTSGISMDRSLSSDSQSSKDTGDRALQRPNSLSGSIASTRPAAPATARRHKRASVVNSDTQDSIISKTAPPGKRTTASISKIKKNSVASLGETQQHDVGQTPHIRYPNHVRVPDGPRRSSADKAEFSKPKKPGSNFILPASKEATASEENATFFIIEQESIEEEEEEELEQGKSNPELESKSQEIVGVGAEPVTPTKSNSVTEMPAEVDEAESKESVEGVKILYTKSIQSTPSLEEEMEVTPLQLMTYARGYEEYKAPSEDLHTISEDSESSLSLSLGGRPVNVPPEKTKPSPLGRVYESDEANVEAKVSDESHKKLATATDGAAAASGGATAGAAGAPGADSSGTVAAAGAEEDKGQKDADGQPAKKKSKTTEENKGFPKGKNNSKLRPFFSSSPQQDKDPTSTSLSSLLDPDDK